MGNGHKRRSSVNFGGKTFLPEDICMKNFKMPRWQFYMTFARKKKIPGFYMMYARKMFFPNFFWGGEGASAPLPPVSYAYGSGSSMVARDKY